MASVFEEPLKKKRRRAPILFAEWTGWLFWLGMFALVGWWIYVMALTPGSGPSLAKETVRPDLPKLIDYSALPFPIAVDTYRVPVSILFPAADLARNSRICRQARTEEQFRKLLQIFSQEDGQVYSFRYLGDVSDNGLLPVVIIPNLPHYKDLAAFKKDFNVCEAGGRHPYEVTSDWLMFMEDCPRPGDRSRGVAGCSLIKAELVKNKNLKLVK